MAMVECECKIVFDSCRGNIDFIVEYCENMSIDDLMMAGYKHNEATALLKLAHTFSKKKRNSGEVG